MGKSLLPDEVRAAYPVEEWHFPAWSKTLVEVLNEFKLGHSKERQQKRTDAADYSRMSYEELRTLADNDSVADTMSNEESAGISLLPGGHGRLKPGTRLDARPACVTSTPARTCFLAGGTRHAPRWDLLPRPSSRKPQRPLSSSVPPG